MLEIIFVYCKKIIFILGRGGGGGGGVIIGRIGSVASFLFQMV